MATKRQIQIVENFIKNETKRLMKEENMTDDAYMRILDSISNAIKTAKKKS